MLRDRSARLVSIVTEKHRFRRVRFELLNRSQTEELFELLQCGDVRPVVGPFSAIQLLAGIALPVAVAVVVVIRRRSA